MLWFKALHLIAMVTWFAGLFYLPRLFVYHASCKDEISLQRFKIMEHRLFWYITTPGGIATVVFGLMILPYNLSFYLSAGWLHAKLFLVFLLILFHIHCGITLKHFKQDKNTRPEKFFRYYNEFPTIILIAVIILAVVRPF